MGTHNFYTRKILQHKQEIAEYLQLLKVEGISSYLEIGSKWGANIWRVADVLPPGARIVSLDMPWGTRETELHLKECIEELKKRKFDAHLILGDSTDPDVIARAAALGPYDAIFIDANHTEPYIRADFKNYSPMAKKLIGIHDISYHREPWDVKPNSLPIDVPKVWPELREGRKFKEIRYDFTPTKGDNGIGVLWVDREAQSA